MLAPDKWPRPRNIDETRLVESVKRRGGHVVTTPYNLDFGVPDYAHSVGFYASFGQPEVIIMGVSAEKGVLVLSELCRRISKGMEIIDQQVAKGLFDGRDCMFRKLAVYDAVDHVDWLLWFYTSIQCDFPLMQVLWPDKQGRFPIDPACSQTAAKLQEVKKFRDKI